MFNLDDITNENNEDHNLKWQYIPDHPYRMLIIGGFGSGKTNALLNLIEEQDSDSLIDKIYLYAKDLNELKYQFLIKKGKDVGIKHLNDWKAFTEYSQWMIMFTITLIITAHQEKKFNSVWWYDCRYYD